MCASNGTRPLKERFTPHQASSAKQLREDTGLRLLLKACMGTTTTTVNGFDTDPVNHLFAYCAGSATILTRIDDNLDTTQQLYYAKQEPVNVTTSFYNSSTPSPIPGTGHRPSPLKSGALQLGCNSPPCKSPGVTSKASARNRETTCVSLNSTTKWLAVGEVLRLLF